MKRLVFATLFVSFTLIGCNNRVEPPIEDDVVACEDVSSPSDLPWLEEKVKTGLVYTLSSHADTFPVEFVDKVFYTTPESEEENVAFVIQWYFPSGTADAVGAVLLDCDGNRLATYGGQTGCNGLCDINIISRVRIYEMERSPQEKCERAIRGEWGCINEQGRKERLAFCTIGQVGSEGPLVYDLADWLITENQAVAGTTVTLTYSITPPDTLNIKLQLKNEDKPRFAYSTHYLISNDTLLTIDRFSYNGTSFKEMMELSLIGKY